MSNIKHYAYSDIKKSINDLLRQMNRDNWRPDYVVGVTRGGLLPAVMISHYLDIPMHTLKVCLRDNVDTESNCWMAEEAFGYVTEEDREKYGNARWDPGKRSKILLIDDMNDSGATFKWIVEDWQKSCLPQETIAWQSVWNKNVRFAALVENSSSQFDVDYVAETVDKNDNDIWCVFPWEDWWK